jgi:predicted ATPase/DNA-binding SARP family transcriptional activator
MAQDWRVQLLGEMQVVSHEKRLPLQGHRTIGPLLAFLAYHPGQQTRDTLLEHFWPGVGGDSARLSLRVALSRLRKLLGEGSIIATVQHVGLQADFFQIDTVGFLQCLELAHRATDIASKQQALETAITLYNGPLLAMWTDAWILSERERMESAYLGAIHQLVEIFTEQEAWEAALAYTVKALLTAPLYEEAHRDRMRVFLKMGRLEAARRQYQELEIRLQKEHLPPPSTLTQSLLRPRLATSLSERGWLPDNLTRFFGREKECADLRSRLLSTDPVRLITLAGLGGSGKTRLAFEVAKSLQNPLKPTFTGGIWWVSLTEIQQEERVLERVLSVLQPRSVASAPTVPTVFPAPIVPGERVLERIVALVRDLPVLLVLDGVERVPEDILRNSIGTLLQEMPTLSLLVTARRPLRLAGEQIVWVESLVVPETTENIEASALQMLVDRVQLQDATFQLTPENLPDMVALCQHLDGLPLALEMAASRFYAMSPRQVRTHLSQRFALRDTLHWSYELLSPASQEALRRLCVFRGGWSLEAMEAVCNSPHIWDILTELRDCSLIKIEEQYGSKRFWMIDMVRDMARDMVEEWQIPMVEEWQIPDETTSAAHALWYVDLAKRLWEVRDTDAFAQPIEQEYENILAAVAWCQENNNQENNNQNNNKAIDLWIELLIILTHYWWNHANFVEARRHLRDFISTLEQKTIADESVIPTRCIYLVSFLVRMEVRANRIAHLPAYLSYFPLLERLQSRGPWCRTAILTLKAYMHECLGEMETAVTLYEEVLHGNDLQHVTPEVQCNVYSDASGLYTRLGRFAEADALVRQGENIARTHDKPFWLACLYAHRSETETRLGDAARARHYLSEAEHFFTTHHEHWWLILLGRYKAKLALVTGAPAEAEQHLRDYCQSCYRSHEIKPMLDVWDVLARVLLTQGKSAQTMMLLGAGQMLRETQGFFFTDYEQTRFTQTCQDARESLPSTVNADTLWQSGLSLSAEAALKLALPNLSTH